METSQTPPTPSVSSSAGVLGPVVGVLFTAAAVAIAVVTVVIAALLWVKKRGKEEGGYARNGSGRKHKQNLYH